MNRVVNFDTERFAPDDRLRAWHEHIEASVFEVGITPFDPAGLSATSSSRSFDGVTATVFRTNQHVIERTPGATTVDPRRKLYISIMLEGEATFYQPTSSHIVRAGEALLYSPREPYALAFSADSLQIFLDIDERYLSDQFAAAAPAKGIKTRLDGVHGMSLDLLLPLSRELSRESTPESAIRTKIEEMLPQLLTALDADAGDSTYSRAMRAIRVNGYDATLTVSKVAQFAHVSARQLSRAFAGRDTTPAAELWHHRVDHACELIRESDMLFAEVAHESGFGSLSTMTRAFQREGLGSPSAYRKNFSPG